jgi:formate dehydrogenase beta subunit
MHCAEPGCLAACPADSAIVQYKNGIVDFQQDNCIGCQFCVSGCPFNVPRFNPETKKVYKCTLCSDRVGQGLEPACIKACPTGCLHFGSKTDMLMLAEARVKQLRDVYGWANAGIYDPKSIGGTSVVYVLHDAGQPEKYGGLPSSPSIPISFTVWKDWFKPVGLLASVSAFAGVILHYVTEGPRRVQPQLPVKEIDGDTTRRGD